MPQVPAPSLPEPLIVVGLHAVVVALHDCDPVVLVAPREDAAMPHAATDALGMSPNRNEDALPFGPFAPTRHRTMEMGLRNWVTERTGLQLGYVEQLYTFGDRDRYPDASRNGHVVVSVGYLALTGAGAGSGSWRSWYSYFPWEDWRDGRPASIDAAIAPCLGRWADAAAMLAERELRRDRIRLCFGLDGIAWDSERVLERYELLYEAGLATEGGRDGTVGGAEAGTGFPGDCVDGMAFGRSMRYDHRRVLATALTRLRGKIKYRPVIFELMPDSFTLLRLQKAVEALQGAGLHKQNFRRQVASAGLVEPTGRYVSDTGGRPAEQFRFRPEVVLERPQPGVRVSPSVRGRVRLSTP